MVFTVIKVNYESSLAVTNVQQLDFLSDNCKKPQSITLNTGVLSWAISTHDLNALLLKMHLSAGKSSQVLVSLKNTVLVNLAPIYFAPASLSVTPYSIASYVYVPGAYQNWSPATPDSLVSFKGNRIYSGIINFTGTDHNFKITNERDWNGISYGAGTVSTTRGNLTSPAHGGILVTLNLSNNTIAFAPQWSIIGDASPGGWSTNTNMYFDKVHNVWYINTTLVCDGTKAIKFRFGNYFAVNLGVGGGKLTQGGGDVIVPSTKDGGGTYKIILDVAAYTLVSSSLGKYS